MKLFTKLRRMIFGKNINESTTDMCNDWNKIFPNKCMICSYYKFGRNNAFTTKFPPTHACSKIIQ